MRGNIGTQDVKFLRARRQYILNRLATVSNGTTTQAPDGSGLTIKSRADMSTAMGRALAASPGASGKPTGESALPPGTHGKQDMTVREDKPPHRDEDLYGHYLYRFTASRNDYWQTERLCSMAERDYYREIHGNRSPWNEDGPARDRRILADYEGWLARDVAYHEDCGEESVRRLRRSALLDPETGQEMELDRRTERIVKLSRDGMSQTNIAQTVGVNQSTVSRVLGAVCA